MVGILFVIFAILAAHVYVERKKRRTEEAYRRAAKAKIDMAVRAAKTTATLLQKDQYFNDLHRKQILLTGTLPKDSTTSGLPNAANAKLATQARAYISVEGQARGNTSKKALPRDNSKLQDFFVVDDNAGNTLIRGNQQQPRQKGTQSFYVPGTSTVTSRPGYAQMHSPATMNRTKANAPLPKLPEAGMEQPGVYGARPTNAVGTLPRGGGRESGTMNSRSVHFNAAAIARYSEDDDDQDLESNNRQLGIEPGHYGRVPSKNPNLAHNALHEETSDDDEDREAQQSHYGRVSKPPVGEHRFSMQSDDGADPSAIQLTDAVLNSTDDYAEMPPNPAMARASKSLMDRRDSASDLNKSSSLKSASSQQSLQLPRRSSLPRLSFHTPANMDHTFRPWYVSSLCNYKNCTRSVFFSFFFWITRFHGAMNRQTAEALLRQAGMEDGLFLVRASSKGGEQYALSVCFGGVIYHNLIEPSGSQFINSYGSVYPSLAAMIDTYKSPSPEVQTPLTDFVRATKPTTV